MRLPTPEEAEILLHGLAHHRDQENRDQVSTRRDQLMIAVLCFVLVLSVGRCAQVGGNYDELTVNHDRANDQVRLLAAEHAQRDGHVHNAASLLTEVRQPTLGSKWEELTLASLNTPLVAERITSSYAWRRAKMTPKSTLVERYDQRKALWSGQPLKLTHELGSPTHLDHDESGQHWVSFESGMLLFWSIESPQATQKRLPFDKIKSLHLSHEGTIAAVLNQEGVASLYRSYNYPVKEFGGIKGASVVRSSLSPDRKSLLLIDARDGVQSVSLTDERVDLSIESPQGLQLRQSLWIKSTPPSVILHYSVAQDKEQRLIWYQRGREPILIHQGRESITQFFTSPHLAQLVVELKTSSRQADRSRILKIIDLTHPQHANSVITPQLPPVNALTFDPTGTRLVVSSSSSSNHQLKLFSLRERSPALTLKTTYVTQPSTLHISQDGQSILGLSAEGVTRWNALDGRLLSSYHSAGMTPISLTDVDGSLRVAFSDQEQQSQSAILTWLLNEHTLSVPVSTLREEIADVTWHDDELIIGNHRGEVTLWSAHQLTAPKVKFQGHQERVSVIKVNADQQSFISASTDGSVAKWSLRDGRALARYEGHKSPVTALAISPRADQDFMVTGDRRGMIWYWREGSPKGQSWRGHGSQIRDLSISPKGDLLISIPVSKREEAAVWKLKKDSQPQQLASLPKNMIATLWTKRGQELVLIGVTRQGQIISWRPVGGALKELGSFGEQLNGALLSSVQFSSQGDWLIGLTDQGFGVLYHVSRAQTQLITIPQGKLKVAQFLAPDDAALPSGSQPPALALGSSSGRLWLWREGRLMPLGDHQGPIVKLKVSPTDGSLISASETFALRWQGPFLLDDLKEKLSERSRICLSPAERTLLLAEPLTEAKNQHQRCVENR
jgi:WD40 repeat protein